MGIVYIIFEWLLVLALAGLIGSVVWLMLSALKIKNGVMSDAKRLYEPPTRAVKSLIATGKGIVQQEGVRVRHIADSVKVAAAAVSETAGEVKVAAEGIHASEIKSATANVKNTVKFVTLVSKLAKFAAVKQRPAT